MSDQDRAAKFLFFAKMKNSIDIDLASLALTGVADVINHKLLPWVAVISPGYDTCYLPDCKVKGITCCPRRELRPTRLCDLSEKRKLVTW